MLRSARQQVINALTQKITEVLQIAEAKGHEAGLVPADIEKLLFATVGPVETEIDDLRLRLRSFNPDEMVSAVLGSGRRV
jgi:hypothetical protein